MCYTRQLFIVHLLQPSDCLVMSIDVTYALRELVKPREVKFVATVT